MDVESGKGDEPMNSELHVDNRDQENKPDLYIKQAASKWGIISAFLGASSVAMGAFAAHGLKAYMSQYELDIIAKAAQYQMYHALAIMFVTILIFNCGKSKSCTEQFFRRLKEVNFSFTLGTVLFSGSLYALAFTQLKIFAFITPIGGVLFLVAWLWLMFAFYREGKQ